MTLDNLTPEQMLARIRELEAELAKCQWQPIETAPPNTSILVYFPLWEHWGPPIYRAILVDQGLGTSLRWYYTAPSIGIDKEAPSHWMPLPEPPA